MEVLQHLRVLKLYPEEPFDTVYDALGIGTTCEAGRTYVEAAIISAL